MVLLHHLPTSIHILSMIVSTSNRILIDMCELDFNPCRVISLLMRNRAHRVAEAMSSQPSFNQPQQFNNLIYSYFTDQLLMSI